MMPAEYDPAEAARLDAAKAFVAGDVPPTPNEMSKAAWKATIDIGEATKRRAQRQLGLLRSQAEIIGEQIIEEQRKIDMADYNIESARKLMDYYTEHPDDRH